MVYVRNKLIPRNGRVLLITIIYLFTRAFIQFSKVIDILYLYTTMYIDCIIIRAPYNTTHKLQIRFWGLNLCVLKPQPVNRN